MRRIVPKGTDLSRWPTHVVAAVTVHVLPPPQPLAGLVVVLLRRLLSSHGLGPDGSADRAQERRHPSYRAAGPPVRPLSPTERPGLVAMDWMDWEDDDCSRAALFTCQDLLRPSRQAMSLGGRMQTCPVSGERGKCRSRTTSANNHRTVAARNPGRNGFDYGVGGAVHLIPEGGPRRPGRGPDVSWAGVLRGLTGFVQRTLSQCS